MNEQFRVLVADDHNLFREGLASAVDAQPDMQVVGQAATAGDAICLSRELSPDIVVLDLNMPGGGLPAAAMIASIRPSTKIVVLTISSEEEHVQDARMVGVHGYILKGVRARELIRMLHTVLAGGSVWPSILTI